MATVTAALTLMTTMMTSVLACKQERAPTAPSSAKSTEAAKPAATDKPATPAAATAAKPEAAADPGGNEPAAKQAHVEAGDATLSSGALSKPEISKFVDRQKASILLCYKRAVQKKPSLSGEVTAEFTISPTGKVLRPQIKSSTLGDEEISKCIAERMQRWRFPAPEGGEAVTVTYPFSFTTR